MRLALFDVDGTVLRGNSWHEYFWWTIGQRPALAPPLLALLALRGARAIAGRTLREAALRPLRGLDAAAIATLGRRVTDERLRPLVRPAARREILRSVTEGCVPVLATGAFDFLAQPLAVELGVAEVICTKLEFADGCCRGRIAGPELRGAAKAGAVRAHFEGRDVDWAGSRAFSDDREDAPLLSLVGEPWFVSRGAVADEGLPATVRGVDWDGSGTDD